MKNGALKVFAALGVVCCAIVTALAYVGFAWPWQASTARSSAGDSGDLHDQYNCPLNMSLTACTRTMQDILSLGRSLSADEITDDMWQVVNCVTWSDTEWTMGIGVTGYTGNGDQHVTPDREPQLCWPLWTISTDGQLLSAVLTSEEINLGVYSKKQMFYYGSFDAAPADFTSRSPRIDPGSPSTSTSTQSSAANGTGGSSSDVTYPPYPGGISEADYWRFVVDMTSETGIQSVHTGMVQIADCIPTGTSIEGKTPGLYALGISVDNVDGTWVPNPRNGSYCVTRQDQGAVNIGVAVYTTFTRLSREQIDLDPQIKDQIIFAE